MSSCRTEEDTYLRWEMKTSTRKSKVINLRPTNTSSAARGVFFQTTRTYQRLYRSNATCTRNHSSERVFILHIIYDIICTFDSHFTRNFLHWHSYSRRRKSSSNEWIVHYLPKFIAQKWRYTYIRVSYAKMNTRIHSSSTRWVCSEYI